MRSTRKVLAATLVVALVCSIVAALPAVAVAGKTPPAPTVISGRTFEGITGMNVPGSSVEIRKYNAKTGVWQLLTTLTSDASGRYTYQPSSAGEYDIRGYAPSQQLPGGTALKAAIVTVSVVAGQNYTVDLSLEYHLNHAGGRVTQGGAGLAGCEVRLYSAVPTGTLNFTRVNTSAPIISDAGGYWRTDSATNLNTYLLYKVEFISAAGTLYNGGATTFDAAAPMQLSAPLFNATSYNLRNVDCAF